MATLRGKIHGIEWERGDKRGPMVSALIKIELTRSKRQGDADAMFSRLKAYMGKDATIMID